jgi:hypothetical protein
MNAKYKFMKNIDNPNSQNKINLHASDFRLKIPNSSGWSTVFILIKKL